jgi:hypothetical protein
MKPIMSYHGTITIGDLPPVPAWGFGAGTVQLERVERQELPGSIFATVMHFVTPPAPRRYSAVELAKRPWRLLLAALRRKIEC